MNQITLNTQQFSDALSKAVKGSGRFPMLLVTMAIGISAKNGNLNLYTTDSSVTLKVTIPKVVDPTISFYTCTDSAQLYKLVSKMTTEKLTLSIADDYIEIKGNGVYKLPLYTDEEGNICTIRPIKVEGDEFTITKMDLDKLSTYNKVSLSKIAAVREYTGYYISEQAALTYNEHTLCNTKLSWKGDKVLLPKMIVDLFATISDKEVAVTIKDNKIKFVTPTINISGTIMEGVENYPDQGLLALFEDGNFDNTIKVNRLLLEGCLDRIGLFVKNDEMSVVTMVVDENGLLLSSSDTNGCERIPCVEKSIKDSVNKNLNIVDLQAVISTISDENIVIGYGNNKGILVKDTASQQVVPYITEAGEEEVEETSEASADADVEYEDE